MRQKEGWRMAESRGAIQYREGAIFIIRSETVLGGGNKVIGMQDGIHYFAFN